MPRGVAQDLSYAAAMSDQALRLLRQIRTCFVILTVIATIWFAAWFVPSLWVRVRNAPGPWTLGVSLTAIVAVSSWLLIAAVGKVPKQRATPTDMNQHV
jgi:hypothetical protein